MKLLTIAIGLTLLLIASTGALVRFNFVVIEGSVTWWQVEPVVSRGIIQNDREYRAVLAYVEQIFASGGFDRSSDRALAEKLNALLATYHHAKEPTPHPPSDGP